MNQYFASKNNKITFQEKQHCDLAHEAATEGIVLLENNGILPLKHEMSVALFGDGARQTLICGMGAASVNYRSAVSIEEGLEKTGIIITNKKYLEAASLQQWEAAEKYYDWLRKKSGENLLQGVFAMYSNPFLPVGQKEITVDDMGEEADLAIYVISRNSGEGADRKNIPGDYQLMEDEKKNLKFLDAHYKHLIVLLNTVGVIDTQYLHTLENLDALLMIGLGGNAAGDAVADVLMGIIPPSGKLTATWAEHYEDYPNASNYAAMNENLNDEYYTEGIYVGYRYFDSFSIQPAYCFGYGKTYANFRIEKKELFQQHEKIGMKVVVTNISDIYAGKEVVQVYVSAPEGELEKPYQSLAGYIKTSILAPGEKEELTIALDWKSIASYSEREASWVLEPGNYLIRLGNSSKNTHIAGAICLKQKVCLEQCRNLFASDEQMTEMKHGRIISEKDTLGDEKIEILELKKGEINTKIHIYEDYNVLETEEIRKCSSIITFRDVVKGNASISQLAEQMTVDELAYLCVGNVSDKSENITRVNVMAAGTAGRTLQAEEHESNRVVPGASETTSVLQKTRKIPKLNLADGGSGVRLIPEFEVDEEGELLTSGLFSIRGVDRLAGKKAGEHQFEESALYTQYATALPMATVLAQTWNQNLLKRCGNMIGCELVTLGVDLWLAPSMNIHRNPLCGRNFEYYSEDPLVTGKCGIAMVHGAEMYRGVGATIKHLACNNQEDNRGDSNAHVSERALREIYLRGYEMVILNEKPTAMMTSLNLINGIHAANNYDLLTAFARKECGFNGLVMTDWGTTVADEAEQRKYPCSSVAGCIKAGNDLIMPGTLGDIEGMKKAIIRGELLEEELRNCAKNILRVMLALRREG